MTWLTRFHRNAFHGPEINRNPIVYIGGLTFDIRARAVHHKQKLNLHQVGEPIKRQVDYNGCVELENSPLSLEGQCATEIQLLNTPHDRLRCRQAMPLLVQLINTHCFPQKKWCVHFRDRGWGRQRYLPPRLCGDMATRTAIAHVSSFNLLLMSTILVDKDGNCRRHAIIEINHGWVCVVDINSLVIARCGDTTHSRVDVNNTHLSMINPINAYCVIYDSEYEPTVSLLDSCICHY